MNKRSRQPLSKAATGSTTDHTEGTFQEYPWCVGSSCSVSKGEETHPCGAYRLKRAGQAVIANRLSQVRRDHVCEWVKSGSHFLFPQQAKPWRERAGYCRIYGHLWERLVFISRRHLPRRTIYKKKKKNWQGFRGWRGSVFKSCH